MRQVMKSPDRSSASTSLGSWKSLTSMQRDRHHTSQWRSSERGHALLRLALFLLRAFFPWCQNYLGSSAKSPRGTQERAVNLDSETRPDSPTIRQPPWALLRIRSLSRGHSLQAMLRQESRLQCVPAVNVGWISKKSLFSDNTRVRGALQLPSVKSGQHVIGSLADAVKITEAPKASNLLGNTSVPSKSIPMAIEE